MNHHGIIFSSPGTLILLLTFLFPLVFKAQIALADYPAILGNGYDELKMEHKTKKCAQGEIGATPAIEVIGEFNKVESWDHLKSQMHFSIPGAIYLNADNELAKFVFRARDTHLTSTYVMGNHIGVKKEYLSNSKELPLDSKNTFRSECGTQYISLIEYGGELHVGVKFSFSNMENREQFEVGGTVQSLVGLGAHVRNMNQDVKKNSSVEIFFHQVGGNVSDLNKMFESGDIVACSLEKFDKCEELIMDLWSYSTDRFAKAVLEGKMQVINFHAEDYHNQEKLFEDPVVRKERRKLLDLLDQHQYDRDLISTFTGKMLLSETCDGRCISYISTKISSNIRTIKESIAMSFKAPEQFLKYGKIEHLDLYKYDFPKTVERSSVRKNIYRKYFIVGAAFSLGIPLLYKLLTGNTLGAK